jgi:hypothetical protein
MEFGRCWGSGVVDSAFDISKGRTGSEQESPGNKSRASRMCVSLGGFNLGLQDALYCTTLIPTVSS